MPPEITPEILSLSLEQEARLEGIRFEAEGMGEEALRVNLLDACRQLYYRDNWIRNHFKRAK